MQYYLKFKAKTHKTLTNSYLSIIILYGILIVGLCINPHTNTPQQVT
jgi:hypothetical protein